MTLDSLWVALSMRRALPILALFLLGAQGKPSCPDDMVLVSPTTCMDRFEWPNRKGEKPLVGVSAVESVYDRERGITMNAWDLCASVGKRLCTMDEWVPACKGKRGSDYPFGRKLPDRYLTPPDKAPCNYAQWFREPNELRVFNRDPHEFEQLYQADPSGSRPQCTSASGVQDMMGNAEEWIVCPDWMSRGKNNCRQIDGELVCFCLAGRYWSDAVPCHKLSSGHSADWWYYETGFRCCQSPH